MMSSSTLAVRPKSQVLIAEPKATLDFYESLRGANRPCWFIRVGLQGPALSNICASPRAAWKNAHDRLIAFCVKAMLRAEGGAR